MTPSPARHQVVAPITDIQCVAPKHFRIAIHAPAIAAAARAGQFVHILPREAAVPAPFLRRAFSIMAVRGEEIDILFRLEGVGTAQIAGKRVGDGLDVLGPLGLPFDIEVFHVKHRKEREEEKRFAPILVGGGVGVPPMVFLAETLQQQGVSPLMLIGARSAGEVLGVEMFAALGVETRIATDDGSAGHQGRVIHLLEAELVARGALGKGQTIGGQTVIYGCGPLPMLRAVAGVGARFGAPCQVSLEENMPCGIGVCNGCVVAMKSEAANSRDLAGDLSPHSDYGRYERICVVGPAVWADRIDWEVL